MLDELVPVLHGDLQPEELLELRMDGHVVGLKAVGLEVLQNHENGLQRNLMQSDRVEDFGLRLAELLRCFDEKFLEKGTLK